MFVIITSIVVEQIYSMKDIFMCIYAENMQKNRKIIAFLVHKYFVVGINMHTFVRSKQNKKAYNK